MMKSYGVFMARIGVVVVFLSSTLKLCAEPDVAVGGGQAAPGALPLSGEAIRAPSLVHASPVPTSLRWKDRDYGIDEGIELLMGIITDPRTSADERTLALSRLSNAGLLLKGRKCLEEIIERYRGFETLPERAEALSCFNKSGDPRGLPLFYEVLDTEKDPRFRYCGASGLASWNIRRGVEELIGLLSSTVEFGRGQLGVEAAITFNHLNRHKGWGFPEDGIQQEMGAKTDLNDEQKRALYIAEITKWFAENEHRFPHWKLGDPLPEVTANEKSVSDGKKP